MFGSEKGMNNLSKYELTVENERLKIQNETLQFKLEQVNEKYSVLEQKLQEAKSFDVRQVKSENESLKNEIDSLRFKLKNDTKGLELETENKKLKAQIEIQEAENKHLKELIDAYRAMPDVKNMVDNLSSLAVPHMDELKEFSQIISNSKVVDLHKEMSEMNNSLGRMSNDINFLCHRTHF